MCSAGWLDIDSPNLAIIFGRTKRGVDELSKPLSIRGYSAEGIHGDLTQAKRDSVLRHFREGTTEILVATDVAAKGWIFQGSPMSIILISLKIRKAMCIGSAEQAVQGNPASQQHLLRLERSNISN